MPEEPLKRRVNCAFKTKSSQFSDLQPCSGTWEGQRVEAQRNSRVYEVGRGIPGPCRTLLHMYREPKKRLAPLKQHNNGC